MNVRARLDPSRELYASRLHFLTELGRRCPMLRWALIFLVIGLIAGLLGFTDVAGASIAIAKTLFFVFIVIFLVLLILGLTVARRVG